MPPDYSTPRPERAPDAVPPSGGVGADRPEDGGGGASGRGRPVRSASALAVVAAADYPLRRVRRLVSKKKRRYEQSGYDLDLSYVTPQIIAMGFPSTGYESLYRNPHGQVKRLLDERHGDSYKVYNLCSEGRYRYEATRFGHRDGGEDGRRSSRVAYYPFNDHEPPPLLMLLDCVEDICQCVSGHCNNVAVVHCKAGKGRTGLVICCALMRLRHLGHLGPTSSSLGSGCESSSESNSNSSDDGSGGAADCDAHHLSAEEALSLFGATRTHDGQGVTIPSQRRYVGYYSQVLRQAIPRDMLEGEGREVKAATRRLIGVRIHHHPLRRHATGRATMTDEAGERRRPRSVRGDVTDNNDDDDDCDDDGMADDDGGLYRVEVEQHRRWGHQQQDCELGGRRERRRTAWRRAASGSASSLSRRRDGVCGEERNGCDRVPGGGDSFAHVDLTDADLSVGGDVLVRIYRKKRRRRRSESEPTKLELPSKVGRRKKQLLARFWFHAYFVPTDGDDRLRLTGEDLDGGRLMVRAKKKERNLPGKEEGSTRGGQRRGAPTSADPPGEEMVRVELLFAPASGAES